MKKIATTFIMLLWLIAFPSCEKKPEVYFDLMSFNLFVFDELGTDLANPKGIHPLDASQITVSSELAGKPMKWDITRSYYSYDETTTTTFNMTGFYYFEVVTYDFFIDESFVNKTIDVAVSIEGRPDSIVTFHFNDRARVYQIDVNGKRVADKLNGTRNYYYNVKLMYDQNAA